MFGITPQMWTYIQFIEENFPISTVKVIKKIDISYGRVYCIIYDLSKKGIIETKYKDSISNIYKLTSKGERVYKLLYKLEEELLNG